MPKQAPTIVKEDLARAVYESHGGLSQKDCAAHVDVLLDLLKRRLIEERRVLLSGFGKFELVRRRARRIADPNTGQHMVLPDRWAVKFKPSQTFTDKVNNTGESVH